MKARNDQPFEDFICFALYSANIAMHRFYKPILDALDLTYPQYLVMVSLWQQDGVSVGKLAEQMLLESSTITPLLKRLEAAGYISRDRSPEDERVVTVKLTDLGSELKKRMNDLPSRVVDATGLNERKLAALRKSILTMRNKLGKVVGE